jgi:hypothetical protein
MSVLVVCPSRGRPDAAAELQRTFEATRALPDTGLVFALDADDPTLGGYAESSRGLTLHVGPPVEMGMNGALNEATKALLSADADVEVAGFVGDDHRFRTPRWDVEILDLLRSHPGVAFADDRNWHEKLPTMWFISRRIVGAFGMGLGTLRHLYIDNYWLELAGGAGCLTYLPDVVIEHMHPAYGKGNWDEGYRRVNSEEMYSVDRGAFELWKSQRKPQDVQALRELLAA